jgi:hypothetical protein
LLSFEKKKNYPLLPPEPYTISNIFLVFSRS